jgi:coatomer subunit beta'
MEDSLEMYASFVEETNHDLRTKLQATLQVQEMIVYTTDSVHVIQRQLFARSERVKGIDFHPVEPWILTTLYSGMFLAHGASEVLLGLILCRSCLHMVL